MSSIDIQPIIFTDYTKIIYEPNTFTKTLILYVFYEYNDRVKCFIQNGLINNDKFDFLFIINNKDFDVNILNLPPSYKIYNKR